MVGRGEKSQVVPNKSTGFLSKTTINIKIVIKALIFSFKGWKAHLRETGFKRVVVGAGGAQSLSVALAGCTDVSCCSALQWQQKKISDRSESIGKWAALSLQFVIGEMRGIIDDRGRLFGAGVACGAFKLLHLLTECNYAMLSDFIESDALSAVMEPR